MLRRSVCVWNVAWHQQSCLQPSSCWRLRGRCRAQIKAGGKHTVEARRRRSHRSLISQRSSDFTGWSSILFAIIRLRSSVNCFCVTLTSISELFSQVASRSIINFFKETGFYRKIALFAHPRKFSVQIGGPGPASSSRQRSRIPRTVHSAVRRAESIITPFCIIQLSSRPASSSLDCWCKGVSGGRANSLKQFARWHYVNWQSASFSSSS